MSFNHCSSNQIRESASVPEESDGLRLDQVAARLFPDYSRARLQEWIRRGALTVDGKQMQCKQKVRVGAQLELEAELEPEGDWVVSAIPLNIVYEDEHVLVVNKTVNFVVHPAAGHHENTLLNALLHHLPAQKNLPRGGIVHRLDKDTSGLMVVAKTLLAHNSLVQQLKAKTVLREYIAIVNGVVKSSGTIDKPLGRHRTQRLKIAVVEGGKAAVTHYKILNRYPSHSLLQLNLETGRTHQIRVHLASIRHPIVGDPLYGGRPQLPKQASQELITAMQAMNVQALHARRLSFDHPATGERISFEAGPRDDMVKLIDLLASKSSYSF